MIKKWQTSILNSKNRTHLTRISAVLWKFRGKVSRCAFDKRADGVVPPSGPPEDGTPSTPPATSSSASSSGSSGRAAAASSQSSISLDEEGVFAGELKVGVKATLALYPCLRLGCNEREVNKVKHSVTDSCSLPVNQ